MKFRRVLASLVLALSLPAGIAAAASPAPPAGLNARDFAREPAIQGLSISPSGKNLVGIVSPDGDNRYIAIWETANPGKAPVILGAQKMRLMSARFIKDDRLAVVAQQLFTVGTRATHLQKIYITDLKGEKWTPAIPDQKASSEQEEFANKTSNPSIVSTLPNDPKHILVIDNRLDGQGDIYKVDIYRGTAERLYRGSDKYANYRPDWNGNLRARSYSDFDNGAIFIGQQFLNASTGQWEDHFRSYARDRNLTEVAGFSQDPNIVYVSKREKDKEGIYEYDLTQKKIVGPAFEHKLFEAGGVLQDKSGRLLGFSYLADEPRIYWTDEKLAAIAKGLGPALGVANVSVDWNDPASGAAAKVSYPDGAGAYILDWSDDLKYVLVEKSGPNLSPEYYLLTDGAKLTLLGKSMPHIPGAALGDSRLVQYKARDGLVIPAFLHTPSKARFGAGPYPAIVLPHGGPTARDYLGWDVSGWSKYFTARGYVVIQPQFRGSAGWGDKIYRAGDRQWGLAMQDDNDDAAKYLVSQGLAAPDRVAIFGYSYGGYAAMAASIRPNGLYQCAISGAGAPEIRRFQNRTYENRFLREFQRPTVGGVDLLDNAGKASIPIFVYHGDRDTTVEIEQSERFVAALKTAGRPHRYLAIKDMGHQYNLMTPAHIETQLVEIEKYLTTECGPGGL
jgi:dipeptidyl aminopeptidase/acylaminoacyl peptidase